jgi:hypothetical protein
MKAAVARGRGRRWRQIAVGVGVTSCLLLSAVALAEVKQKSQPTPTPKPIVKPNPSATAATSPAPKPSSTPETNIDSRTEAELLQAEDRFVNAIRNHDAKELEELLHPHYADAFEGAGSAVSKRGVIVRATDGRLPAYHIEKERKLIRSGDSFTVEGLAKDLAQEMTEDNPSEHWAFVRRLWSREGGRWTATAQTVAPLEDNEARERLNSETKKKQPD